MARLLGGSLSEATEVEERGGKTRRMLSGFPLAQMVNSASFTWEWRAPGRNLGLLSYRQTLPSEPPGKPLSDIIYYRITVKFHKERETLRWWELIFCAILIGGRINLCSEGADEWVPVTLDGGI